MNKLIIIFALLFTGVLTIYEMNEKFVSSPIWQHIDAFATAFTLILVFKEILDSKDQLKNIRIYLEFDDGVIDEIFPIKRKNFSRAELKGILRELHGSRENYRLSYMSESDFFDNIFAVQDGKKDSFIMKIRKDDFFEYTL